MLCDRLTALTAGAFVGIWYAKNFPAEKKEGGGGGGDKGKDKGKEKDKGSDKGKDKK